MRDTSVTATTLTHWLRRYGTLPSGAVVSVRVELEFETTISKLVFLTATYSSGAPPDLPVRLVIKSSLFPAVVGDGRTAEAEFYHRFGSVLGAPPIVRCVGTSQDDQGDPGIIVLEDIRTTHDHPPWPLPPSRAQCELALDALVHLHAQWWEDATLGAVGNLHTEESLTNMVQGIAAHLPAFIDTVGDTLTTEARRVLERVFGSSLRPWMRLTDHRALTVIHGDAHTWNFLFPRSGEGAAFLLDWQLWHLDLGARDLAFLIALHWYPSRRRELELPLVRYYHDGLLARGIGNYQFSELWLDYRLCAVRNLTIPLLFWSRGMKPEGWWHRLECALAAYRDLDCDELL
jgi:hypothetical protein